MAPEASSPTHSANPILSALSPPTPAPGQLPSPLLQPALVPPNTQTCVHCGISALCWLPGPEVLSILSPKGPPLMQPQNRRILLSRAGICV